VGLCPTTRKPCKGLVFFFIKKEKVKKAEMTKEMENIYIVLIKRYRIWRY